MAKRKRLTPARIETAAEGAAPETRAFFPSYPLGVAPTRRMPIAEVAGEAAGVAALDELGRTLGEAREEGRLIQWIGLDEIDESYLVRDRIGADEEEMQALIDSLRERGQQTAIEVADLGEAAPRRWGLISGWRRLTALRRIAAEDGVPGRALALPRSPRNAAEAYRAMVEENEIRVGLSHYERARIVARAADAGVYDSDAAALKALFGAATRPRRSKIGSFVRIVRVLDAALRFPTRIGERLGLALSRALEEDPGLAPRLRAALDAARPETAEQETDLIAAHLPRAAPEGSPEDAPATAPETAAPAPRADRPARPSRQRLRDGLDCQDRSDGALLLSGPLLSDPAFRARLIRFLEAG